MKAVTRTRNPRGQGDRLRVELVDAAVDLIAESGSAAGVSVRAAAKRVGVSPMAVYNHFADRDALVEAAVRHCWAQFQAALAPAYDEGDPATRLRAAGGAYARFAMEHPGQYAVLFSPTDELPPGAVGIGMSAFDDLVALIGEVLAQAGDDRDPIFVALQVHTWIHGIVSLRQCGPDIVPWPSIDEQLDDLVRRLGLT